MGSFLGKINFLKLKNACVISVNGNTGQKKGVFIPIEDNNIFVSTDDSNKAKGAYLKFAVFEAQPPGKFGDTHMIKQSFDRNARSKMSDEEKRAMPILGNMKPMEFYGETQESEYSADSMTQKRDDDSLPF